ncbi:unnamed protein product [Urochloa humidicola]
MDVAFSATTTPLPIFLPTLDGPSRLSPAPGAMAPPPPLLAENDVVQAAAAPFGEDEFQDRLFISEEELQALMVELDQCEPPSFSKNENDLQSPPALFSPGENDGVQLQAPQFAVDDDEDILAALRCEEGIQKDQEILAAQQQPSPPPQSGAPRSGDGQRVGEPAARRRQATTKQSGASKKSTKRQRQRQQQLRSWHRWIATCVLTRQLRGAPEVSGGRTALRCQCLELARAEGPRRRCALHQEGAPGREWISAAPGGGGIPLPPVRGRRGRGARAVGGRRRRGRGAVRAVAPRRVDADALLRAARAGAGCGGWI